MTKDGGPAYPTPSSMSASAVVREGMSLHEYYAGQALMGIASCLSDPTMIRAIIHGATESRMEDHEYIASRAHALAAAMIKEGEKYK